MAHLVDALLLETVRSNQRNSQRFSHPIESDLESDSEYTYEEVEVEVFETDESDDEDNLRIPDTILEPPITETDDQIPDCVLESDQTSRFSIPCNISEDSCDVTTNSCPNLTDCGLSSRAEMADDEDEQVRSDQSSRTLGYNTLWCLGEDVTYSTNLSSCIKQHSRSLIDQLNTRQSLSIILFALVLLGIRLKDYQPDTE